MQPRWWSQICSNWPSRSQRSHDTTWWGSPWWIRWERTCLVPWTHCHNFLPVPKIFTYISAYYHIIIIVHVPAIYGATSEIISELYNQRHTWYRKKCTSNIQLQVCLQISPLVFADMHPYNTHTHTQLVWSCTHSLMLLSVQHIYTHRQAMLHDTVFSINPAYVVSLLTLASLTRYLSVWMWDSNWRESMRIVTSTINQPKQ